VDPVALLKREHEMILEQLHMIEATIGRKSRQGCALLEPGRSTLCELFRFFTGRVGVHYKREATLISALSRVVGRKNGEREQFESLLCEHRTMKADAAGIMKQLVKHTASPSYADGADPLGIRSFVKRFRNHIACEERILFVLADMRLAPEQKQRVSHRMLQV
jgi:hemerythrin-like domain-containing protein